MILSGNKKKSGLISGSIMVTLARITASACAFALFWYISQNSVGQLGAFRTLFIYFLVFEFLPLLGMNQFIIREIAKTPEKINNYLFHSLVFSLMISSVMAGTIFIVSYYGGYSPIVAKGLLIIIASIPATAMVLCFQSVLIATGRGGTMGGIQGIEAAARTVAGLILIYLTKNIIYVVIGFVVFRWCITLVYWKTLVSLTRNYQWKLSPFFFRSFLKTTPQFAGILILFLTIRFAGQLMVPWMEGDVSAGFFAIVYQFLDLILLVPTAFTINLMPILSRKGDTSLKELADTGKQAMKLVSALMIPCTVFICINAQPIILMVFGEQYQPSVYLVRISIWTGLILSLDQILSTSMIASGHQRSDLITLCAGAFATIIAMYFLILYHGIEGAALGLLAGTMTLFTARVIIYILTITLFNLPAALWRQIIAGTAMAVSLFMMPPGIILPGFIGSLVYLVILFSLGFCNHSEKKSYSELLTTG